MYILCLDVGLQGLGDYISHIPNLVRIDVNYHSDIKNCTLYLCRRTDTVIVDTICKYLCCICRTSLSVRTRYFNYKSDGSYATKPITEEQLDALGKVNFPLCSGLKFEIST